MTRTLYIMVDASGSMNEMGKIHLQRNLCRYSGQLELIDQDKYSGLDIRLYQWARNVSELVLQSNGDVPALNAESCSNICALSDFLSLNFNDTERTMVLILSDGNFSNSEIISFQNKRSIFPSLIIRTVAIGADADLFKLKKISTNNTVYLAENIASAIDSAIFDFDEPLAAPVSIAMLLQSDPADSEESEEDWGE